MPPHMLHMGCILTSWANQDLIQSNVLKKMLFVPECVANSDSGILRKDR